VTTSFPCPPGYSLRHAPHYAPPSPPCQYLVLARESPASHPGGHPPGEGGGGVLELFPSPCPMYTGMGYKGGIWSLGNAFPRVRVV
jgi:hypothetical protein